MRSKIPVEHNLDFLFHLVNSQTEATFKRLKIRKLPPYIESAYTGNGDDVTMSAKEFEPIFHLLKRPGCWEFVKNTLYPVDFPEKLPGESGGSPCSIANERNRLVGNLFELEYLITGQNKLYEKWKSEAAKIEKERMFALLDNPKASTVTPKVRSRKNSLNICGHLHDCAGKTSPQCQFTWPDLTGKGQIRYDKVSDVKTHLNKYFPGVGDKERRLKCILGIYGDAKINAALLIELTGYTSKDAVYSARARIKKQCQTITEPKKQAQSNNI